MRGINATVARFLQYPLVTMLAAGKAFGDGSSSISSCLVLKQFDFLISNTNRVSKGFLTFGVILCFVSVCFDVVLADLPGSGLHHTRGHHKYHNKSFIKPARGFSC